MTLADTLKLFQEYKGTFLIRTNKGIQKEHIFSDKSIRKSLDMQRIKVISIEPRFESVKYGDLWFDEFVGIRLTVTGITQNELQKGVVHR